MSSYRVHASTTAPVAEVNAILNARPAGWVRRFLRLALHAVFAHEGTPSQDQPDWYRLGRTRPGAGDTLEAPLSWRPHRGVALFSRFAGQIIVMPSESETILCLEGEAPDGPQDRNTETLQALVDLLASAVSALNDSTGSR